jgi:hypothetical protein
MVSLDDLLSEVLKNLEAREAYEAEKKVLAEETAEWEAAGGLLEKTGT